MPRDFSVNSHAIKALHTGYLQAVDDAALMKLARQHDLLIYLQYRPSKFVIQSSEAGLSEEYDRNLIKEHYNAVMKELKEA